MRKAVTGLALALALAACGDDGDPTSCRPDGVAEVTGTVAGQALGPFVRAAVVDLGAPIGEMAATHALVLDEVAGACGAVAPTGKHLVVLFCASPIPQVYPVTTTQGFRCPTDGVLGIVERDGGTDLATSTSGSVTIDAAAGCVRGTYALQLGADSIEGTFDAVACDAAP